MRVLICGSRTWTNRQKIRRLIQELPHHAVVIHGGHWQGADAIAEQEARKAKLRVEAYPANWAKHGKSAGPKRNARMLRLGQPEFVFAFRAEGESRGTDDLVKKARGLRIPTYVVRERDEERYIKWNWQQLQIEEASEKGWKRIRTGLMPQRQSRSST